MTEMLQKTENVSKNVANENSQDLTEQWKKGELPYGRYYVELAYNGNSIIMAEYWWDKTLTLDDHKYSREEVKRILAPVPSYGEWKDLKSKLQLKDTAYDFDTARLEEQNAQLKELLKECFEYIDWTDGTGSPINQQKLLDKIDEVLK